MMSDKYILNEEETRKMHNVQLEMMIELDKICRKHNIKYILEGGSLLGAVRHKGFIPWDNDMDVRMLRPDYERFCEIANKELSQGIFFQNYNTDKGYPWLYGKLRKQGTKAVRLGQDRLKMESGIWLDIFPCDGVPDNNAEKKIHNKVAKLCRKTLYARTARYITNKWYAKLGWNIVCIIPRKLVYKVSEYMSRKYTIYNCKKVGIIGWHGIEDVNGFELRYFNELTELEFEGHKFYCPRDWDNYLRYAYGDDYMVIPSVENRQVDLDFQEFDLGKEGEKIC